MRRHGLANPYEQLKALTRGHGITQTSMREFIASRRGLDEPPDVALRGQGGETAHPLQRRGRGHGLRRTGRPLRGAPGRRPALP